MNKIHIIVFLVIFTIAGLFCSCSNDGNGDKNGGKYIMDMAGRKVWVPDNVERILCKGPGTLRFITYLQATDKVIGIEGGFEKKSAKGRPYRIAHEELTALPTIGTAGPSPQADSEAVLQAGPDVVFISYAEGRIVRNLQDRTGIPVVVLDPGPLGELDPKSVFQSLELAGNILGKEERAQKVIEFIKATEHELKQRVKKLSQQDKSRVYVGGLAYKGSHGITSTQVNYPGFELLDLNNVAGEISQPGHMSVSKERILQWNPDVIFIDGGGLELILTDYQKNPQFYKSLKAVENNQVHVLLPYNYYTTNIGSALANYFYIGKVLYSSAFEDVNPAEKAERIYSFLVGKGVFKQMQRDYRGFKKLHFQEIIHGRN